MSEPEARKTELSVAETEYERLITEIRNLKALITMLTSERDDLKFHICRDLAAEYSEKIGNLERDIMYAKLQLLETKRMIEILQSQINRQEEQSEEKAREQAEKEYREYEEELNRKAEEARQERKRQEEEAAKDKAWEEEQNSGRKQEDSGNNGKPEASTGSDGKDGSDHRSCAAENNEKIEAEWEESTKRIGIGPAQENASDQDSDDRNEKKEDKPKYKSRKDEMKALYRKIVKTLHPDVNPNLTEEEKQLFRDAVEAYNNGDLERLREIAAIIDEKELENGIVDGEEASVDKLKEIIIGLKLKVESLKKEIYDIKHSFPYTMKEFLQNEKAVAARRTELENLLQEYRDEIERLRERMNDMLRGKRNEQRA